MKATRKRLYLIGVMLSIALTLLIGSPVLAADDDGNRPPPVPTASIPR